MKKKINFLSGLAGLCASALMLAGLASCNNISASLNQASIIIEGISAEEDNKTSFETERTVLANTSPSADFTNIELYGTPANGTERKLSSWDTYESMVNSTEVITLDGLLWDFTLKAKRYGASFTQTLTDKIISSNDTTALAFNGLALTTDSVGKGKVHVEFTFPSSLSGLSSCKAVFGDDEEITLTKTASSYVYEKDSVEEGSYLLTFKGLNAAGSVIFTYPTYVVVKKGYISSDSINAGRVSSITRGQNTPVKVTYKMNYGSDTTADFEQTYNKGSSILTYSAAGFTAPENCLFVTWATTTTLAGYRGTDFKAYDFGAQPSFTEDTTLYAIWLNKTNQMLISYYLDGDSSSNYVEIVDVAEGDGKKLKTVVSSTANSNQLSYGKPGYKFFGWDTKADYTGERYDNNAQMLYEIHQEKTTHNKEPVLKLYAIWVPEDRISSSTYTIKDQKDYNICFNSDYIGSNNRYINISTFKFDQELNNQTIDTSCSKSKYFEGTLDGNGVTIKNLPAKMFYVNQGTIKDLTIAGSAINDDAAVAYKNVGNIKNCTVLADVKGTNVSENIGAICAINTRNNSGIGIIENCKVSSNVSNTKADNIGAITGINEGIIKKCKNYTVDANAKVTAARINGNNNVGGIAGANYAEITYCKSAATAIGSGNSSNVGGIAGYNGEKTPEGASTSSKGCLAFCYFWGSVGADKSIQATNVGGMIGKSEMTTQQDGSGAFVESTIQINSHNFSIFACGVAGTLAGGKYAGGLIGYNIKSAAVNSYAAIEKCSYVLHLGEGAYAGLYAYCENPVLVRTFNSNENGRTLYSVKAPEESWTGYLFGDTIASKTSELLTNGDLPSLEEVGVEEREPGDSDKIPLYVKDNTWEY